MIGRLGWLRKLQFQVPGSPSDDQLDSTCPVLVNERQQAPYAVVCLEILSIIDITEEMNLR